MGDNNINCSYFFEGDLTQGMFGRQKVVKSLLSIQSFPLFSFFSLYSEFDGNPLRFFSLHISTNNPCLICLDSAAHL